MCRLTCNITYLEYLLYAKVHRQLTDRWHISTNTHSPSLSLQVLVVRKDGCLILFDDYLLEQKIPDTHSFDNRVNATQLPVRSVAYLRQPIHCVLTLQRNDTTSSVWCGTNNEVLLSMDVTSSQIHYYQKHQARTYAQTSAVDILSHLRTMVMEKNGKKIKLIWALSSPGRMLYLWDADKGSLVMTLSCDDFTTDDSEYIVTIGCFSLPYKG